MMPNDICSLSSVSRVDYYLCAFCLVPLPKREPLQGPPTQSVFGLTEQELVAFLLQEDSGPLSERIIVTTLILILNIGLKAKQYKYQFLSGIILLFLLR